MYINLFLAGVLTTLFVELVAVFGVAIWLYIRRNRKGGRR